MRKVHYHLHFLLLTDLLCKVKFVKTDLFIPFHNFQCPPYFNETNCNHQIALYDSAIDAAYMESTKKVHILEGLNTILNAFQESHFLIIVTDFQNTWYTKTDFPVILRKLRLVFWWYWNQKASETWQIKYAIYVPNSLLQRETGLVDIISQLGGPSPYLSHEGFLPLLEISDYWRNTRPWNNIVSISLFPHIRLPGIHLNKMSLVDHITRLENTFFNILPPNMPQLKILLIHPSETDNIDDITAIIVSSRRSDTKTDYVIQERLYIFSTTFATSEIVNSDLSISIENFQEIQLCRRNFEILLNLVSMNPWSMNNFTELMKPI